MSIIVSGIKLSQLRFQHLYVREIMFAMWGSLNAFILISFQILNDTLH